MMDKLRDAVLVVEDDELGREYLTDKLRAHGYVVIEAETVCEAEAAIDASAQTETPTPATHGERDKDNGEAHAQQVSRRIGAIVLDGRFPWGDDQRDATEGIGHFLPATAVVRRAQVRGLGNLLILGFSANRMHPEEIGLRDDDDIMFTDVGKMSGGTAILLDALARFSEPLETDR